MKNNDFKFEVNNFTKAQRENISMGLIRIAAALLNDEMRVLSGGIIIKPVDGGVKLTSDIVLLEGKLND